MRIQHNIAAMSAYRNYTNNVSAVNKNLEKLSSGYKINRAGDDAAGLAISEKMRAQISGLEAAQKNAKDGISLVKTAEGALTEVHDMLNRMVTLATQSANGTYDNETDRVQLQKEMDQLRSEINRIADSSNFNGIKLLDGSMDGTTAVNSNTVMGLNGVDSLVDRMGAKMGAAAYPGTYFHQDRAESDKTSFTMDLEGRSFTVNKGADGVVNVTVQLQNTKNTAYDLTDAATKTLKFENMKTGDTITAEQIVDAYLNELKTTGGMIDVKVGDPTGTEGTDWVSVQYAVTKGEDGHSLKFEMTDTGWATAAEYAAKKSATGAANGLSTDAADYMLAFQGTFNLAVSAAGNTTNGATVSKTGLPDIGASNVHTGSASSGTQMAEAMIRFVNDAADITAGKALAPTNIRDGSGIMLGDTFYVWGGTDATVNAEYSGNVKVIDIRDLVDDKGVLNMDRTTDKVNAEKDTLNDNLSLALSRFTEAANDNKIFSVEVTAAGDSLAFTERVGQNSGADLTSNAGLMEQIKMFSGIKAKAPINGAAPSALTLQIGDTADSFNQLKVNISDMHTAAMGIADISIATQAGAAKAVDAIKNAINYVSDVRGTLGATQNRLDHTINNLSVMQENIQDAESTIRDTDIAAEMMAYTKNNILVQSAQAMLAQANQIPQGVLQLLG